MTPRTSFTAQKSTFKISGNVSLCHQCAVFRIPCGYLREVWGDAKHVPWLSCGIIEGEILTWIENSLVTDSSHVPPPCKFHPFVPPPRSRPGMLFWPACCAGCRRHPMPLHPFRKISITLKLIMQFWWHSLFYDWKHHISPFGRGGTIEAWEKKGDLPN